MSLINIPRDMIINLLSILDLESLANICQTSSQLYKYCDDDDLWIRKYQNEFNERYTLDPRYYQGYAKNFYLNKVKTYNYEKLKQVITDILLKNVTDNNRKILLYDNKYNDIVEEIINDALNSPKVLKWLIHSKIYELHNNNKIEIQTDSLLGKTSGMDMFDSIKHAINNYINKTKNINKYFLSPIS